jgi:hypothetical protein
VHHHVSNVIHPEPKPLAPEADDAWTSRPDHLHVRSIIEPDLAQPVDHVSGADDPADATLLTGPKQR